LMLQFYGVSGVTRAVQLDNFPEGYTLNTVFGYANDFWSMANQNGASYLPRWKTANSEFVGDFHIYDASYDRLKTGEIAYNFQKNVLDRFKISDLRLYVNGNNLWYWSRLPDDRESGSPASKAYPVMKRINLGVNITF